MLSQPLDIKPELTKARLSKAIEYDKALIQIFDFLYGGRRK
jgi:hypothetical protein